MDFKKLKKFITNKKEFLWLMSGQGISIIFSFIIIKFITKIGTADFGVYSLILSISALVSAILIGPSEQGFVRYFFNFGGEENKKRFLNVIYLFFFTITGLLILISVFFYFFNIIESPNVLLIGVFVVLFTFSSFFASIFNLIRERKLNTKLILLEKLISTGLLYVLKVFDALNIKNVLVALIISILISVFLRTRHLNLKFEYFLFNDIKLIGFREFAIYKKVFIFSIPFLIWGFFGWLQNSSDRWVIAHYSNLETVGIYSLMITLSSYLIATPIGVVSQYFQPIIFENTSNQEKTQHEIKKYIITSVLIVVCGFLISLVLGKLILSFIAVTFSTYWYYLPFFSLSVGIFQIGQCFTIHGLIYEKPKIYLTPKILIGVISLLLNIFGIYYFQIIGLTISIVLTSTIYLFMIIGVNKTALK